MALPTASEPVPFHVLPNGAARLIGSRMALEGVIELYKSGLTAEEIHENFNAPLAEVHASIAYYLRHAAEVEEYLAECEREWEKTKARLDAQPGYQETKARILARWAERQERDRATG